MTTFYLLFMPLPFDSMTLEKDDFIKSAFKIVKIGDGIDRDILDSEEYLAVSNRPDVATLLDETGGVGIFSEEEIFAAHNL